ncbi:MAG: hypothetical protein ACP5QG_05480 [candidate division WOR-3 bacterium]
MKERWFRIIIGITMALLAVLGGAGLATENTTLVTLIIGGPILILAFLNPKATVFLVFFFSIIYHDFVRQYIPTIESSRHIMDLLILALFARAILSKAVEGRFNFTFAFIPMVLWFILVSVSASINQVPVMNFLMKLRQMGMFILFFYAIANLDLDTKTIKAAFWFVFALVWIQVPVAFWHYRIHGMSDNVRGLTPGGPEITFLLLWATAFVYGLYLYTRKVNLPLLIVVSGIFLVIPVMSGIRAVFYFYPVLAGVLIISSVVFSAIAGEKLWPSLKKGLLALGITSVSLAFAVLTVPSLNKLYHRLFITFVWGLYNQERVYAVEHVGRFVAPKITHAYLAVKGLPGLLGGYGLGSIILSKFVSIPVNQTTFAAVVGQLTVSMYETGYLGVALYMTIAIGVAWLVIPCFRMATDGDERAMIFSFVVPAVSFIGMTVYYWVWIEHIAGTIFWGLGGLLAALYYYRKREIGET